MIDLSRPGPVPSRSPWVQAACTGTIVNVRPTTEAAHLALRSGGIRSRPTADDGLTLVGEYVLQPCEAPPAGSFPAPGTPQPRLKKRRRWPWFLAIAAVLAIALGGATFRLRRGYWFTAPPAAAASQRIMPAFVITAEDRDYNGQSLEAFVTVIDPTEKDVEELSKADVEREYFLGDKPNGTPLKRPPVDAGEYTVVAHFPGSDRYQKASSEPKTFHIKKATPCGLLR